MEAAGRMGTKQGGASRIEGIRQNASLAKLASCACAVGTNVDIRLNPVRDNSV